MRSRTWRHATRPVWGGTRAPARSTNLDVSNLPPPGRTLDFEQFAEAVVEHLRDRLSNFTASSKEHGRIITLRRGDQQVTLRKTGEAWVVWRDGAQPRVMCTIEERRDRFVADNVAGTIASALSESAP